MPTFMKIAAVLITAAILGSRFRKKERQVYRQGGPWYQPYLSPSGILILVVLLLPVVVWLLRRWNLM